MNGISSFYNRHFRQKLFNKIVVIYSLITILSLASLSVFIYTYMNDIQVQKQMELNKRVINSIGNHLNLKHATSQQIVQQIYKDDSNTLLKDVNSFLNREYSDYLMERLQRYVDTDIRTLDILTYLRLQLTNNSDIREVALYSTNLKFLYVLTQNTQSYYLVDDDLDSALQRHVTSNNSFATISNITSLNELSIVGKLIINYDSAGIYQAITSERNEMKGYAVVLTPEGDVIFDSSGRYNGRSYPYISMLGSSSPTAKLEEDSYLNSQIANQFGFWVAGIVPKSDIKDELNGLQHILLSVTSVCIAGALALAWFTIVSYSKRTNVIVKAMKKLQDGDLLVRIPLQKEDELSIISKRFNQMCEDLTQYIDQMYKSEIRLKHAELIALQAQINPHFLYNTLEAIRMRAIYKKADDVGEMIYLLASMFRYSVNNDTTVTLEDEIEYCRLYLDLFRLRYSNNFSYEIDIEPEWMNTPVLRLSIQPIIENYVVHGLVMSRSDNQLWINAVANRDRLFITIRDNGIGIMPAKLEQLRSRLAQSPLHASGSIGLINVNERIKLCYGSEFGIEMDSTPGQGTLISMTLPASADKGESS